ncbi:MAG: cytochrome c biogenesis protein/redoxin, partial [Candidatus Ornithospirochaeta sp.]
PCIGPILSSVLIAASLSTKGTMLLVLYSIGFILPFLILSFFSTFFIAFLRRHMGVVKYTARIGAVVMIALGALMIYDALAKNVGSGGEAILSEQMMDEKEEEPTLEKEALPEETNVPGGGEVILEEEKISPDAEEVVPEEKETPPEREETVLKEKEDAVQEEDTLPSAEDEIAEETKSDIDILTSVYMDQYGRLHRLSSYKGKTVFINFWATWCGPCRSEMKYIEELYQTYKDSDVVVIAVASPGIGNEGSISDVKAFLKENGYTYPVLMDTKGELSAIFGITAIPTTFMFSSDGNLFGYVPGSIDYERMVDIVEQTRGGRRN